MDPKDQTPATEELKTLIKEDISLSKENNALLKAMHRSARWGMILSTLKWVIVFASLLGLYYYSSQFVGNLFSQYGELLGIQNKASSSQSTWDKIKSLSPL